jgi:hypothetical protein
VAAKYRHLIEKWRALEGAERLMFARATRDDDRSFNMLLETLQARFPGTRIALLFVRRGMPAGLRRLGPIIVYDTPRNAGPAPEYWKGDDANWDAAIAALLGNQARADHAPVRVFD